MLRLLALLAFPLLAPLAAAQSALDVTLLNLNTRAPLVAHTVTLANESIGYQMAGTTDATGRIRFDGLSTAGAYTIFVPETGAFYAQQVSDLTLRANFTRSVTVLVVPVSLIDLDGIEVTGQTSFAELNGTNAEVSSTLSAREVASLPIEGRDVTRALYRLPNVTQATGFFPEAPNVSINGANSLYAGYLIDGLDNTENFLGGQKFTIPIGFVQNVTVLTNNYSTEFGRTGNGVFNITTKSGGNSYSGEAFYLTRPGPVIDASSPYAQRDLSGNQVKDGFMRQQGGFAIGGPIVRDQTFFFVNVEQTFDFKDNRLTVPQLGINDVVAGQNQFSYLSGKIDHRWSRRFRSSLRAHVGITGIERQGGGLEGGVQFPSAASTQDRNAVIVASQNTYLGGPFVYESNVQYARFRWNYGRARTRDRAQVVVLDPQENTVAILGHPGYFFDDVENSFQVQQKLTYRTGIHQFKVGADVLTSDFQLTGGGNPLGNYRVQLTQAQLDALRGQTGTSLGIEDLPQDVSVLNYNVELRPSSFGARQNQYGVYVEDQFTPSSRLTLTLGLRYDYDNLSKGGSDTGDYNNIAPRFAFNYGLDARTVVRGGYGIVYDKVLYALYSDALQQNSTSAGYRQQLQQLVDKGILPAHTDLDRITFDGNMGVDFQDVPYLGGPTPEDVQNMREGVTSFERRILNPSGYQNPYTHQFSLGFQRQIEGNRLFYVDLVHTRSFNLFRLRNLNAPAPYAVQPGNVAVRTPAQANATRPTQPPTGGALNIVMSESAGESRYYAASVNLLKDRVRGDDFAYRLSYTLSRLRNNTEDINFRAMDANNFEAEWGPSINDRTHVLSGILYYYPVQDVTLSLATLLQSGQPINRIPDAAIYGTTDLNGDGQSFGDAYVGNSDRSPGETRNSDRLPWSNTFDVGAQYHLRVGGSTVELRADVFNVFNTENLSGYSNNATQSNQIQAGPASSGVLVRRNAAPPRQFQFGVRYLF